MAETFTIVLKGDGSGLTGTMRTAEGDVRRFNAVLDTSSGKTTAMGGASRKAAADVNAVGTAATRTTGSTRQLAAGFNSLRGTLAALGISFLAREILDAGLSMDRLERSTAAALGSQRLAGQELAFVREQAERLGIYFPVLAQGYAGLAAATRGTVLAGEQTRQIFLAVAESGRAMNLTADQIQGTLTALQQIAGKGTVSMEELRQQLGDRLPGAMQIAARAMDMNIAQFMKMVSEGKLLASDFLPKFAKEMRAAAAAGVELAKSSPAAEFDRLKTAMFEASAQFARGGILQALASDSKDAAKALKDLVDARFFERLGGLMVAGTKIAIAYFAAFRVGIPLIAALQKGFWGLAAAITGTNAAFTAGLAASTKASIASIGLVKIALGSLFAFFAGWELGKWFRENFLQAQLAGIAFVRGLLTIFEQWRARTLSIVAEVKRYFQRLFEIVNNASAAGYEKLAAGAEKIGLDGVAEKYRAAAAAVRQANTADTEYQATQAKINAEHTTRLAQIGAITDDMADYAIAEFQARDGANAATASADALDTTLGGLGETSEELAKKLARLAAAQADFARENRRMAADLAGPAAQAWFTYQDGVDEANAALGRHEATQSEAIKREDLLRQARDRSLDELARSQDILGQIHADYAQQIAQSGMSAEAYRVEEEMIRRRNDALQAHLEITPELEASWRAAITQGERQVEVAEAARGAAQDYQNSWLNAVDSVWRATGDFITRSIHSWKDFGKTLLDIGKRWVSDLIAQWGQNGGLSQAFQRLLSGGFSGAGSSGGGIMGALSGGSGGSSNFMGTIVSGLARMFGFGGAAASATATGAGWASGASTLMGGAGTLSQGGSVFTASGAAASLGGGSAAAGVAAAVPIAGAIVAGMMMNNAAYADGFKLQGQTNEMVQFALKKGLVMVGLATATVSVTDKLLQKLGVSEKVASMISGSSLAAKMFGHGAPKIMSEGIQGSLGFGGLEGSSWADIREKGGWFRSDKWSSQTAALNPAVDAAFDQLAVKMSASATDLAAQLGVDISGALGSVHLDLGKITLDADPEKAQEQIAAKLQEMLEGLAGAAVKALGFGQLLDTGFDASEIMGALSASIALVTGGASQLGRALNTLEMQEVTRGVQYFEAEAKKVGETLTETITRITTALGNYGELVGGVRAELLTHGLSQYAQAQLQVELSYRSQVKQANDLAKALGESGARSEDLASIEQLRAQRMADLQIQMEAQRDQFLGDLRLSDLGIGTDQSKLGDAMQQLQAAVAGGDLQRAQQLSQTALGFGRNLMASGSDYNALYGQVTGMLGGLDPAASGLADTALQQLADTMDTLPQDIASAMFNLLVQDTPLPPPPAPPSSGPGGRDPGASRNPKLDRDPGVQSNADLLGPLERIAAGTDELLRLQNRAALRADA